MVERQLYTLDVTGSSPVPPTICRPGFALALTLSLLFATPPPSRADSITLKNGRKLDGIIAKESTNGVTLNVGVGEAFIKTSQIRSIRRSAPAEADAIRAEWQRHYFDHPHFVPAAFKSLADDLSRLGQQRAAAVESRRKAEQLKKDEIALQAEIKSRQDQLVTAYELLKRYPPPAELSATRLNEYNVLIHGINQTQGDVVADRSRLNNAHTAAGSEVRAIADYVQKLQALSDALAAAAARTNDLSVAERYFVDHATARLAGYRSELRQVDLPFSAAGEHAVLDVTVNGAATGRFMLDTGATRIVMSRTFANRAGVRVDTNLLVDIVVADGRTTNAYDVVLDSVQAAGARAERVPALVMANPPDMGLDGLLGMSFLNAFVLTYDARGGKVSLVEFAPK